MLELTNMESISEGIITHLLLCVVKPATVTVVLGALPPATLELEIEATLSDIMLVYSFNEEPLPGTHSTYTL